MVVESNDSSLFLKRNLCLRVAQPLLFSEARQRGPERYRYRQFGFRLEMDISLLIKPVLPAIAESCPRWGTGV
jgi:hypothetical protein